MKHIYILVAFGLGSICNAQVNPVDFEPSGNGADWTWTVFENDTNPPVEIVANPDPSGINTSSTVAKITALESGQPFAGCETMHGSDVGTFSLSAENAFVSIMVYKTVISDVGFKFATPKGASTGEIKVSNTQVNQWERLVFDFTAVIEEPSSDGIDQIIVFPDFQDRDSDNIVYFDNIVFGDSSLAIASQEQSIVSVYPNPASGLVNIRSLYAIDEFVIYNQLGQQIRSERPNSEITTFDVSGLKQGLYFIRIKSQGQKTISKLVVR